MFCIKQLKIQLNLKCRGIELLKFQFFSLENHLCSQSLKKSNFHQLLEALHMNFVHAKAK